MTSVQDPEKFLEDLAAKESENIVGQQRDLLVNMVMAALRAEFGVRDNQGARKDTSYYSGRRAGFICSAAMAVHMLYGANYDEVRSVLSKLVKKTSEDHVLGDLVDPARSGQISTEIVEKLLRV